MPIYEYQCDKCGVYEVNQRITEPALTKCEKCKSKKIQRLISGGSFALKGGGWYSDLYSSSKSSSGSSESKPKTESKSSKSDGGSKSAA